MSRADNGKDTRFQTGEEQAKTARKGGKASAKKRAQKRSMAETWDIIRKLPLQNEDLTDVSELQSVAAVSGANITLEQAMVFAMAKKAMKGDIKAFEALQKYSPMKDAVEAMNAEKSRLELEKLRMEVEAINNAMHRQASGEVVIVDDVPDETD